MKKVTRLFLVFSLILAKTQAQPGSLDNSFSTDGKVITPIGSEYSYAYALAVQTNGKIVVAGNFNNGGDDDFALVRYNTNGSIDNTFGTNGIVTTDIDDYDISELDGHDQINSILIQPDGKIVAVGYSYNSINWDDPMEYAFTMARYNANGSLDNSFDTDGVVITNLNEFDDIAYSVALQADGKIVVTGNSFDGFNYIFTTIRYNANGSLDNSFDNDGIVKTHILGNSCGSSVVIQPDGKILVAGFTNSSATETVFAVIRYNTNGSLDNSFDNDGKVTTFITEGFIYAYSMVLQPDGKIIVAGNSYNQTSDSHEIAVVRYNTNGSLDNSFDSDGIVTTDITVNRDVAFSVALQIDGKILVAGDSHNGDTEEFVLVRYNANGSLDNSFGTNGIVLTDIGINDDYGRAVAIQADLKIVVAGYIDNGNNYNFGVARYLSGLNVGILNFSNTNYNLFIYPNPVTEKVNLTFTLAGDETITIELYDMQGIMVHQFVNTESMYAGDHTLELNFPKTIQTGSYVLSIISDKGKTSIKIQKN